MKYKKGDRVEITHNPEKGKIGTIYKTNRLGGYRFGIILDTPAKLFLSREDWMPEGRERYAYLCNEEDFRPADLYDSISKRIDAVNEHTDMEEIDGIFKAIGTHYDMTMDFDVCYKNKEVQYGYIIMRPQRNDENKKVFRFSDSCSLLNAQKNAMHHLLDHSDVKKRKNIEVGDVVVALNTDYWRIYGGRTRVGDLFRIHRISGNTFFYCDESRPFTNCIRDDVRLATPEEAKRCLIGKEIRITIEGKICKVKVISTD